MLREHPRCYRDLGPDTFCGREEYFVCHDVLRFYVHLLRRLLIVAHSERLFCGDDAHVDILYGFMSRSVAKLVDQMEALSILEKLETPECHGLSSNVRWRFSSPSLTENTLSVL